MILCDTDVIIDFYNVYSKRHNQTKPIIENLLYKGKAAISQYSNLEMIIGTQNKTDQKSIIKYISLFDLFELNYQIFQISERLLITYNLSHGLLIGDSVIAATAICNDLELFTYNTKDFKFISELKLFNFEKYLS